MPNKKIKIAFFGTPAFSVITLETLKSAGMTPELVITQPDKPVGKGLAITAPPVKVWAQENNIEVLQPTNLKDPIFLEKIKGFDVFVVVAYGKIIPSEVIYAVNNKILNIHASLLPKYRGASPLESAILSDDRNTGVTIMQIDSEMDHGPIVAQEKVDIANWPPNYLELGNALVEAGSTLLVKILPDYVESKITLKEQNHVDATYARKIEKTDGEINLEADPYQNFLRIQAFSKWPGTFFFKEINGKNTRVVIKKAEFTDGKLALLRVIPEGKKEMDYKDFISAFSSKENA